MKQHKKGKDQKNLIAEFTATLELRGKSTHTIAQYPTAVQTLYDFTGGELLDVDAEVLERYLASLRSRKLTYNTLRQYFVALASFYQFMVFKKYVTANPIPSFRDYYLKQSKSHDTAQRRQCISIDDAKTLVGSILDLKEKAVVVLLLKTGLRRHECSELDFDDVSMPNQTIRLKPAAKRSNEIVYFDDETAYVLNRWLKLREKENTKQIPALFLDRYGNRLSPLAICRIVTKHATAVDLHKPSSKHLEDRLTPHSLRHWFVTNLLEAGMSREMVKELRGDSQHEAIDIYYHIDKNKLRQSYLTYIPQLDLI
jgi:site-specific recombinase XerD